MPLKQALNYFKNFLIWKNRFTLVTHYTIDSYSKFITKNTILWQSMYILSGLDKQKVKQT